MALLYGKEYSRKEILERVGDISQLAGADRMRLAGGKGDGVEAVRVRTGGGLEYTVVAGRGMDIAFAQYKGINLNWFSSVGITGSEFFDSKGTGWLRSFFGGLLTTCGLTYLGAPCVDKGVELGIHGRISNIPAENLCADGEWEGDEYVIWVSGKMRETAVFGENIQLRRRISSRLGAPSMIIEDRIENLGYEESEHMLLYHMNFGFPLVDDGSRLICNCKKVIPRDEDAADGFEEYNIFSAPTEGYREKVYYHEPNAAPDGSTCVALVNDSFNNGNGLGVYIRFNVKQLPFMGEWKLMAKGNYVVGIEPANCHVEGRAKEREYGTLQYLKPGEVRTYRLEIGVLESRRDIERIEEEIKALE